MRARLLITLPACGLPEKTESPIAPTLIVEDGAVGVFGTDWERILEGVTLEQVNENDVRALLCLPDKNTAFVYLSPIQDVPDNNLFSKSAFEWRQNWWRTTFVSLLQKGMIPRHSLKKAS